MKIRIICVGKVSHPAIKALAKDYETRLSHYVDVEIIEVAESASDDISEEAKNISHVLIQPARTVALASEGKSFTSESFSQWIEQHQTYESIPIQFIIGGSNGLDASLKQNMISFSSMTFPHQLIRVFLLEQLYRSYKIIRHEPYHK